MNRRKFLSMFGIVGAIPTVAVANSFSSKEEFSGDAVDASVNGNSVFQVHTTKLKENQVQSPYGLSMPQFETTAVFQTSQFKEVEPGKFIVLWDKVK